MIQPTPIPPIALVKLRAKTLRAEKTIAKWWRDPRTVRPGVAAHLTEAAAELGIAIPVRAPMRDVRTHDGEELELLPSLRFTPLQDGDDATAGALFDVPLDAPSRMWLALGDAKEGVEGYVEDFGNELGDERLRLLPRVRVVGKPVSKA